MRTGPAQEGRSGVELRQSLRPFCSGFAATQALRRVGDFAVAFKVLVWRQGMQGQGMDLTIQFLGKDFVNHPVPSNQHFAGKLGADDGNFKVRL